MISRTERGWAGHFICGHRCRYHRNTLLEKGKVRVVISTVGAMYIRKPITRTMPKSVYTELSHDETIDTIGHNRYYETMVFMAKKEGKYWEADVTREVPFYSNWALDRWDDDDIDLQADRMHEAVVDEITNMIRKGELK